MRITSFVLAAFLLAAWLGRPDVVYAACDPAAFNATISRTTGRVFVRGLPDEAHAWLKAVAHDANLRWSATGCAGKRIDRHTAMWAMTALMRLETGSIELREDGLHIDGTTYDPHVRYELGLAFGDRARITLEPLPPIAIGSTRAAILIDGREHTLPDDTPVLRFDMAPQIAFPRVWVVRYPSGEPKHIMLMWPAREPRSLAVVGQLVMRDLREAITAVHMRRDGTHFLIAEDGTVVQLADPAVNGMVVTGTTADRTALGIDLVASGPREPATPAQNVSLARLLATLTRVYPALGDAPMSRDDPSLLSGVIPRSELLGR